jgi:hypothetical protein
MSMEASVLRFEGGQQGKVVPLWLTDVLADFYGLRRRDKPKPQKKESSGRTMRKAQIRGGRPIKFLE